MCIRDRAYSPVPQQGALQDASPDASATDRVWTIVGSTKRRGDWVVPERLVLPVALGDVVIDLRQARFTAATTTIEVQGLMGDVKIIVQMCIRDSSGMPRRRHRDRLRSRRGGTAPERDARGIPGGRRRATGA